MLGYRFYIHFYPPEFRNLDEFLPARIARGVAADRGGRSRVQLQDCRAVIGLKQRTGSGASA
jgi:hypothetical protein